MMSAPLRLLLAVSGSLMVALLHDTRLLLIAAVLALTALLHAVCQRRAPRRQLLRRAAILNLFVAFVWLTLPWQFANGGLHWHAAGLEATLQISLRCNAAGLLCIALLSGIDACGLATAATRLGMPAKLARLLAMTVRYLSVVHETRQRIQRAMQARGFRPRCNWRTCEVLALQVALILVHAMLRAERVSQAMRARGFDGHGAAEYVHPRAGKPLAATGKSS